jgi:hypothetical protein
MSATLPLSADAEAALDQWGEDVTFTPPGGAARVILAIVERTPPQGIDGAPRGSAPGLVVQAANRSTAKAADGYGGIDPTEISPMCGTVAVPAKVGDAAQTRTIAEILSQDEGMVRLRLT